MKRRLIVIISLCLFLIGAVCYANIYERLSDSNPCLSIYGINGGYGHSGSTDTDEDVIISGYGFNIDQNGLVTYIGSSTNKLPVSVNENETVNNWNDNETSWKSFISQIAKPCMVKYDGTVDYYLDPEDQTKKLNGTPSDIATIASATAYEGNAMLELKPMYMTIAIYDRDGIRSFPEFDRVYTQANAYSYDVYFTEEKINANSTIYPFIASDGITITPCYVGMFEGSIDGDGRLRSIPADFSSIHSNITREIINTASSLNGNGWGGYRFDIHNYIQMLLIMIMGSADSQAEIGYGLAYNSTDELGALKDKSAFCGNITYPSSADELKPVKCLWLENLWGRKSEAWMDTALTQHTIQVSRDNVYNFTVAAGGYSSGGSEKIRSLFFKNGFIYPDVYIHNNTKTGFGNDYFAARDGYAIGILLGGQYGYYFSNTANDISKTGILSGSPIKTSSVYNSSRLVYSPDHVDTREILHVTSLESAPETSNIGGFFGNTTSRLSFTLNEYYFPAYYSGARGNPHPIAFIGSATYTNIGGHEGLLEYLRGQNDSGGYVHLLIDYDNRFAYYDAPIHITYDLIQELKTKIVPEDSNYRLDWSAIEAMYPPPPEDPELIHITSQEMSITSGFFVWKIGFDDDVVLNNTGIVYTYHYSGGTNTLANVTYNGIEDGIYTFKLRRTGTNNGYPVTIRQDVLDGFIFQASDTNKIIDWSNFIATYTADYKEGE